MVKNKKLIKEILLGLHLFMISVYFGAITIDIIYINKGATIPCIRPFRETFSNISVILLFIFSITILLGLLSIYFSFKIFQVKYYYIASFILLSSEIIVPMFFLPTIRNIQSTFGIDISYWSRIICILLSSITAWIGQLFYYSTKTQ